MKIKSEDIEKLSVEEKRALLAELLKKKAESTAKPATPPVIPIQSRTSATFPLSYGQQRLWYLDQLEPGNHVCNLPIFMHLKGKLNVAALEGSLNKIIARHESLRTNFILVNGEPVQRVAPARALSLSPINLSHLPPDERTVES